MSAVLDAIATAAAPTPADLVSAVVVGRPPRVTGVLVDDVLRLGEGAALVADLANRVTAVAEPDLDDPDVLVLLTHAEAVAICRPTKPEIPRERPVALAQQLSARLAAEHAAGALAVAA